MMSMLQKFKNLFQRIEWRLYKEVKRLRLKNRNPSIIASNCVGTLIYYDMKIRFLSPTINLSFDMNDYVRFLENMRWYLEQPLVYHDDPRFEYPCGMLGDIEIRFNHYKTFEDASSKWEERKKRINWDNLYIIGVDRDGCTYETIKRFDALPYKNKVIITHQEYPEIQSAYCLPEFEKQGQVGIITNFRDQFLIRRYMDEFDYVAFLNQQ